MSPCNSAKCMRSCLFHSPEVDPNHLDIPSPDLQTTVVGLKKAPADVSLIGAPSELGTTGTSLEWSFPTATPTVATLQVGIEPPVTGSDGMPRFDRALTSFTDPGFLTGHDVRVKSRAYLPGNSFHALLPRERSSRKLADGATTLHDETAQH